MSNSIVENEIQVDIEIGDDYYDVTFNRISKLVTENYGADADGNRGEMRTFIDEDRAEDIYVNGKSINEFAESRQNEIRNAIDKWLSENEPED